ncbi:MULTISPECIES: folate-binding protein YgfZ [Aeromicrobium]|uniref:CAF17-like 4Fe-4S cluster assembly/insertion protein YgfZ n=1 Tax=Aeromicrobium TaxID=2040 RepID=UPI0006FB7539|nr:MULTISPECIES: glycine cleavage T C-terminal barrel domain-containing protein [Aeromicrobium]KQX71708.1 folate-binding protein [Aeromicrobium sp. Root472D3]MCL8252106.1 folate-binding protein YgfZ [Aeromicrobium fastidiosum]
MSDDVAATADTTAARRPSPLLALPGAVGGDAPDGDVAAHYGSISAEQRRLLEGSTFVDLSHRDVVTISGPDRLTWLHSLTTQALEGLAPGTPTEVLLLSPQGRIEHGFSGVDDGETFWAHLEPGAGAPLVAFLERMKFFMRVSVADVTDEFAVIGLPGLQHRVVPRATLTDLPAELGDPVGLWAWEALRIEAGHVRVGVDTDDRTIPNEAGLLGVAVHLDKGCYRGQETVARVHTLGRPPRRLVLLHLDGSVDHLPPHGSDVVLDGKVVGFVGSAARHHELGPVALAMVKRNVPVDATLLADGVAATQQVLVDPEAGLHVRPVLS